MKDTRVDGTLAQNWFERNMIKLVEDRASGTPFNG